jgi:hypothetical protein
VHSAKCAMMYAAVFARVQGMERPGPAGEGRAASAIGGEGKRTLGERDR